MDAAVMERGQDQPPDGPPLRVALLGAGQIGSDLLYKIRRSPWLRCTYVAGRNLRSKGMVRARDLGYPVSARGIEGLVEHADSYDLVFDATNAVSARQHWTALRPLGKVVVDLTPSKIGRMIVPAVNGNDALAHDNLSLITCGGQAAIPLVAAMFERFEGIQYVELVTTAPSGSIGRGTRLNLDEYVHATEAAVCTFTGLSRVKAMLNISPAIPPADFRTAISILLPGAELPQIESTVQQAIRRITHYAPGYNLLTCTLLGADRIFITISIRGGNDLLPGYAGNLDIINSAAIAAAELRAGCERLL